MQDEVEPPAGAVRRSPAEADVLIVRTLQHHADVLLRVARRHSLCEDDAADAYQRGIEIFLQCARRLEAATAHRWLYRVVRNEALAIRAQRARFVAPALAHADRTEARNEPSPEDVVLRKEEMDQAAEALRGLKDDEVQVLRQHASGQTYAQIAAGAGWTRTKVNRKLVEGRRRFLAQRENIDAGRECERWRPVLTALVAGRADARQLDRKSVV